jgi:hypothetical protein
MWAVRTRWMEWNGRCNGQACTHPNATTTPPVSSTTERLQPGQSVFSSICISTPGVLSGMRFDCAGAASARSSADGLLAILSTWGMCCLLKPEGSRGVGVEARGGSQGSRGMWGRARLSGARRLLLAGRNRRGRKAGSRTRSSQSSSTGREGGECARWCETGSGSRDAAKNTYLRPAVGAGAYDESERPVLYETDAAKSNYRRPTPLLSIYAHVSPPPPPTPRRPALPVTHCRRTLPAIWGSHRVLPVRFAPRWWLDTKPPRHLRRRTLRKSLPETGSLRRSRTSQALSARVTQPTPDRRLCTVPDADPQARTLPRGLGLVDPHATLHLYAHPFSTYSRAQNLRKRPGCT